MKTSEQLFIERCARVVFEAVGALIFMGAAMAFLILIWAIMLPENM